jgi:hypothetical protein
MADLCIWIVGITKLIQGGLHAAGRYDHTGEKQRGNWRLCGC